MSSEEGWWRFRQAVKRPPRLLTTRTISLAALSVAFATMVALCFLVWPLPLISAVTAQERLDALRTALAIGAGAAGAATLLLAARRQVHQEHLAAATEFDATERRITDLYSKAVDQLGSDKAAVRLGGLYALERLANDNVGHRQTIVDVICAYLRMPHDVEDLRMLHDHNKDDQPPSLGGAGVKDESVAQERQVRLTAQRILARHLRIKESSLHPEATCWGRLDIDLSGATLIDLDFQCLDLHLARFDGAQFVGLAIFNDSIFTSYASFGQARFAKDALFDAVRFGVGPGFNNATFEGVAHFRRAVFQGELCMFQGAAFKHRADFRAAAFEGFVDFERAIFYAAARFDGTSFEGDGTFQRVRLPTDSYENATFSGSASFCDTQFVGEASFASAQVRGGVGFEDAAFSAGVTFAEAEDVAHADLHGAGVRLDGDADLAAHRVWPPGWITEHTDGVAGDTSETHDVADQGEWARLIQATDS